MLVTAGYGRLGSHWVNHNLVPLWYWYNRRISIACLAGGIRERAIGGGAAIFPRRRSPVRDFASGVYSTLHQSSHGFATRVFSLPKQKHSRAKSRQLRRLYIYVKHYYFVCRFYIFMFLTHTTIHSHTKRHSCKLKNVPNSQWRPSDC